MNRPRLVLWALFALSVATLACNAPFGLTPPFLATATPTVTETPTSTPTPIPTPTPTPTPTPSPAEWQARAVQAMRNGDYTAAADIYRTLLTWLPDEEAAAQARLGLGTSLLRAGDYAGAAAAFRDLLAVYPASAQAHDAHFLLADALVGAGDPLAAADEYRIYLAAGTAITAYVNQSLGNALYAGGAYTDAIPVYQAAIDEAPEISFEVYTREKLALTHAALQDYASAIAQYDAILSIAQVSAYRARIEHQAAETLILAGETEAGYERHLSVVETYPAEYYAYLSLVKLVEAGRPVDDFLRGKVDYYGAAYGPAVEALYRYINAVPDHSADAHWYAGLAFLAAGSPDLAAGEFEMLIETHPGAARVGAAWMGLAEAYTDLDDVDAAVTAYWQFVESDPSHARAPEALWKAAQLLERDGDLEAAAGAYMDCHVRYPSSDYGAPALFRSGLQSYRLDDLTEAAVAWDTLTNLYPGSFYHPAAFLWLGKVRLAQGDPVAAQAAFAEASAADLQGYYGLRAADLAANPLAVPFAAGDHVGADLVPAQGDHEGRPYGDDGQAEAEAWLAGWLGLENAANLGALDPALAADPRLQRGLELWRLARFEEGKWEMEAVRQATISDALAQYRLALLFRDVGLYRSSALSASRVTVLSPVSRTLDAPAFVVRLAYPTYYEDLVLGDAEASGLDPLLIFALIRQESLFESLARSSASAHGLMQVWPPTGEQIAAELGWPPGYETADLYRPTVSLRFGTYYLAQQRDRFDGRIDAALAGYNGGPANAQDWLQEAGDDPDLFLELVTLDETNLYLRRIKEYLAVYQALYAP